MREVIGVKNPLINQIKYVEVKQAFSREDYVFIDQGKGRYLYKCETDVVCYNKYQHDLIDAKIEHATSSEIETYIANQQIQDQYIKIFNDMLKTFEIGASLIGIEICLEARNIRYTYFSTNSLQFGEMIKYLLKNNPDRLKIEFFQVGEREYYAINGGLGVCGYELCCHSRSYSTPTITTNLLRNIGYNINLKVNLAGTCGKYKCCLLFEEDNIENYQKLLPDIDSDINYMNEKYIVTEIDFNNKQIIAVGDRHIKIDFDYFVKGTDDSNK